MATIPRWAAGVRLNVPPAVLTEFEMLVVRLKLEGRAGPVARLASAVSVCEEVVALCVRTIHNRRVRRAR
jgi:hypothetical protein